MTGGGQGREGAPAADASARRGDGPAPLPATQRRILLRRRPRGLVEAADLELVEEPVVQPGPGEVLLRNLYLSLDPATRGWMVDGESYIEPIELGAVVRGATIAEVVVSGSELFAPGDVLVGLTGWEEYSLVDASLLRRRSRRIEREPGVPLSWELSALGGNGLTAWFGLFDVGRPEPGQTVLVSAASGGVGTVVGQLAKLHGCRVVGVTSGAERCAMLVDELGFDAAVDRTDTSEPLVDALRRACPAGVDVYFDNVGGEVLNAALQRINVGARVVLCGAISQINERTLPPGPSHYIRLLTKRARMEGFVTMDFAPRWPEVSAKLRALARDGQLRVVEHMVEGIEQVPEAFRTLFTGEKIGKLTVRLAPEPPALADGDT